MPQIRRVINRAQPTTQPGAAQVNPNIFAGEAEAQRQLGGAIRQAGGVASDISTRVLGLQRQRETLDARHAASLWYQQNKDELAKDDDYETLASRTGDAFDSWSKQYMTGVKNRAAKRDIQQMFKMQKDETILRASTEAKRMEVQRNLDLLPSRIEQFASDIVSSDGEKLKQNKAIQEAFWQEMVESGTIRDTQVPGLKKQVQELAEEKERIEMFTSAKADAMAFDNIEDAMKYIDGVYLEMNETDRKELQRQVVRDFTFREAKAKDEYDKANAESHEAAWDRLRTNDFTEIDAWIDQQPFDVDEKLAWSNKFAAKAKAINDGAEDPMEIHRPEIYNPIYERLQTDWRSVSEKELLDLLGAGLSQDDYEKLMKMKADKGNNELSRPAAGDNFKRLNSAWTSRMSLLEDDDEMVILKAKRDEANDTQELRRFILEKPRTDEEINQKVDSMVRPVEDDVVVSLMGTVVRLLSPSVGVYSLATGKISTPQRRISRIKELGYYDQLDDNDKTVLKKLAKTKTVEELIQIIEETR